MTSDARDNSSEHGEKSSGDNDEATLPRKDDVLMGRGKRFRDCEGNVLYTDLVTGRCKQYFLTLSADEKKRIIEEIVDRILEQGRFLKRDTARACWVVISKERALLKTAHAIQYYQRRLQDKGTPASSPPRPNVPIRVLPMEQHGMPPLQAKPTERRNSPPLIGSMSNSTTDMLMDSASAANVNFMALREALRRQQQQQRAGIRSQERVAATRPRAQPTGLKTHDKGTPVSSPLRRPNVPIRVLPMERQDMPPLQAGPIVRRYAPPLIGSMSNSSTDMLMDSASATDVSFMALREAVRQEQQQQQQQQQQRQQQLAATRPHKRVAVTRTTGRAQPTGLKTGDGDGLPRVPQLPLPNPQRAQPTGCATGDGGGGGGVPLVPQLPRPSPQHISMMMSSFRETLNLLHRDYQLFARLLGDPSNEMIEAHAFDGYLGAVETPPGTAQIPPRGI